LVAAGAVQALGVFHAERHVGLAFEAFELGVFEGLLGGGDAVAGPGFELVTLLLEELVVELQRAAEGGDYSVAYAAPMDANA